jgi:ABC-type polysaccharide/polyol phosphate export permease
MRIKEVKHRLTLGWRLVRQDLERQYANGAARVVRTALPPLLCMLVAAVAFALVLRGGGSAGLAVAQFLVVPFALWSFLADVVLRGAILLREHGYPAKRTPFPLWVAALVPLPAAALNQLVLFAVVAVLTTAAGMVQPASAGLFVAAWSVAVLLTAGLAFAVAAVLKAWDDMAPAAPVDVLDNLARSVPVALRKLKREAAELRNENLALAEQVDARLQRLEIEAARQAEVARRHGIPETGPVSHEP